MSLPQKSSRPATEQLTTFYLGNDLFGIEVTRVQEVTGSPEVHPVPLAPNFISGLINLRGQVATALGLSELLGIPQNSSSTPMSVVCKIEGNLVSILVDSIGEVVEVKQAQFESPPNTMSAKVRTYLKGIYKMDQGLLSVLDLEKLSLELSQAGDQGLGFSPKGEK